MFALLIAVLLAGDVSARIERIEKAMYAPCCYQESVRTHRSETALEMKAEIARLVAEGKSDQEIFDIYKQRYGQRIMMEPEGQAKAVAVLVPVLFGILGVLVVAYFVRRWRAAPSPAAAPAGNLPDLDADDF
ncbi:MAG TPA: cytochrome c-type biogenesis protein CcmH [Bryobacteraceae bacterium]|nr:cytochrome c-type biogenesis protein CcmH [Bryobacteraceae bacterium]HOL73309.1 cytochrome c-type biogenesis protein CcmH [Bryobacteraceae bacterium]HOQ46382.1 cytochrome c-type biogenesis protein CcmH [Bryobacteraceae bacterium]HPQ14246.1 cytochrome c-type biogenesis protein CcmH [Bryobacteraceae bacterium]HPU72181.1 cytochrome c-type biogenesis protein CcmH [Bryobacteraceae bacterium]